MKTRDARRQTYSRGRSFLFSALHRARGEHGLTSLEGVIVLSLIGVLLSISVSSFRGAMARERTDGMARAMVREIEAGRQAALTRRETVRLVVTSTGYSVTTTGGTTLRRVTLPEDITATTTCPAGVCAFGRRGIPLAAGRITLTSASTGRTFTITIATGTGAVSQSEL